MEKEIYSDRRIDKHEAASVIYGVRYDVEAPFKVRSTCRESTAFIALFPQINWEKLPGSHKRVFNVTQSRNLSTAKFVVGPTIQMEFTFMRS